MISDLLVIFKVYLLSLGLQFLVWPWISRWFGHLIDRGWALGRILGLIAIGLPIWFMSHLAPVNTDVAVAVVVLLLVLAGLKIIRERFVLRRNGRLSFFASYDKKLLLYLILIEEGLFLLGFLGLSLVRGFQPNILGLEKFMDFGFIKQYLVSARLPANDMWLAGEKINYYSFGHFLVSVLVRVWGVRLEIGYNLMLAWILGTSLALSFSIVVNLLTMTGSVSAKTPVALRLFQKKGFFAATVTGGVMGALLAGLGGNSHVLWYLIKNTSLDGYWYAAATRFIKNTIHEFPGYSFVVSDLHAHVLSLPVVLAFILVLVGMQPWRLKSHLKSVILGVLMGVMMMTNTWDVATYGLLLTLFVLILLIQGAIGWKKVFMFAGTIGGAAGLTSLFWLLNFEFFSNGIRLVDGRSPWWQMGVLWGGHVGVVVLAIAMNVKVKGKKPSSSNLVVVAMGLAALLLLLIPEIVYVKDIYATHQRANTMFKLTYQAFILMSLLFGWVAGRMLSGYRPCFGVRGVRGVRGHSVSHQRRSCGWSRVLNGFLRVALVTLWSGFMLFPIQAFGSYYGGFRKYKGLDGWTWMEKEGDKREMIMFLENNRDGKNLVEAVGSSYSRLNNVSAFSGTPTVMGWRVHEWLWRGEYSIVERRDKRVRDFYRGKDENFVEDFNVGWIVIGPDERREYRMMDERKLLNEGKVVWRQGGSYLIRVD